MPWKWQGSYKEVSLTETREGGGGDKRNINDRVIVCSLENFQWKLSNPCLFHAGCRVKKSILKLKVQILIKQLCSFVIKATICTSTHSAVYFCVVIVLPFHVFWSFLSKCVFVFSEMYLCLHKSICICPDLHQHWTASFPNKGVARACPLLMHHCKKN